MAQRKPNVFLVALAGFLFGLVGAEASFGRLRSSPTASHAPLLLSLEVRDAAGALLASPLLVGEEGKRVHLSLSQPPGGPRAPSQNRGGSDQPGLQMSLDLDPQPVSERAVCLGYRLSLDSGQLHEGRIGVPYGERRSVRLDSAEHLQLHFTVARAGSPQFRELLRARARPLI